MAIAANLIATLGTTFRTRSRWTTFRTTRLGGTGIAIALARTLRTGRLARLSVSVPVSAIGEARSPVIEFEGTIRGREACQFFNR